MTTKIYPRHFAAAIFVSMLLLPITANADTESAARTTIGEVLYAAEKRDIDLIADNMAERFRYSFGDGYSKPRALAAFKREPKLFDELARVISQGCRPESEGPVRDYVCPQQFADKNVIFFGYRAGFRKEQDGVWRMHYFLTGD